MKPALFGDLPGCLHKAIPSGACQRTADTDAPYAQLCQFCNAKVRVPADQHINRLGGNRFDDSNNLFAGADTGSVQTVGTGLCIRSEEHTSELQSRPHLVCRLLLEKKKKKRKKNYINN